MRLEGWAAEEELLEGEDENESESFAGILLGIVLRRSAGMMVEEKELLVARKELLWGQQLFLRVWEGRS